MDDNCAKFRNDHGAPEIVIGLKKFKCIGASPPHDHPHIYLDMGDDDTILCPYCAVLFRYDPRLSPGESVLARFLRGSAHESRIVGRSRNDQVGWV